MRVVLAFTTIDPRTEAALAAHAPDSERFDVSTNPESYWRLLSDLWSGGDGFLLVEHDIEIHSSVLPECGCPEPWCVWPYAGPAGPDGPLLVQALGCVRFSTDLIRAEPDLMSEVGSISQGLPARDWRRLDVTIAPVLRARGYVPHLHDPPVAHHHRYPAGCSCGEDH